MYNLLYIELVLKLRLEKIILTCSPIKVDLETVDLETVEVQNITAAQWVLASGRKCASGRSTYSAPPPPLGIGSNLGLVCAVIIECEFWMRVGG